MTGVIWVPLAAVLAIHDRQISRHGGAAGIRDRTLLEMGCARAMNVVAYSDAGLAEIAAAYAFGVSKAHAFVDGNKRTAFVTSLTFLRLNGSSLRPAPMEGVRMMEDLASGQVSEVDFASWIESQMKPI